MESPTPIPTLDVAAINAAAQTAADSVAAVVDGVSLLTFAVVLFVGLVAAGVVALVVASVRHG